MTYQIEHVSTTDAAALSPVMMNAFSHDPHWRLLWAPLSQPLPLASIITSTTARLPSNLTTGRSTKRHQKAIDSSTGRIVGYARWLLPEKCPAGLQWKDAQVAEPTEEEKKEFERLYQGEVDKDGRLKGLNYEVMDKLSPALEEAEEEILNSGVYLSRYLLEKEPQIQITM
jgi:ribosomal protein S18 acetylase RimI-like enzyme